jgi:hypothetical protein
MTEPGPTYVLLQELGFSRRIDDVLPAERILWNRAPWQGFARGPTKPAAMLTDAS